MSIQEKVFSKATERDVCIYCVLELMRRRGGDFCRVLGQLWWQADPFNKIKIMATFGDYFGEYADTVASLHEKCRHDDDV